MPEFIVPVHETEIAEFNPNHYPAGDSKGGQFAPKTGAGGAGSSPKDEGSTGKGPTGKGGSSTGAEVSGKGSPVSDAADVPGWSRKKPLRVKSLEEAVERVLAGQVVELESVQEAATLITKLADMAKDAKAKGQKAPVYDLCNVSVPGTNLFCAHQVTTKAYPNGIPRVKMPQLGGAPVPGSAADKLPRIPGTNNVDGAEAFMTYLKDHGVSFKRGEANASDLHATQAELDGQNVAGLMLKQGGFDFTKLPVFISRDNYIVDGHHRWAALVGRDSLDGHLGDVKMNVIRVDAPITEILAVANTWMYRFGIKAETIKKPIR